MVVKQNRHNIPVVLTREAFDAGRFGRILMAQCNVVWNRYAGYYTQSPWLGRKEFEGGALYTQVSHFLDLLIWLAALMNWRSNRQGAMEPPLADHM